MPADLNAPYLAEMTEAELKEYQNTIADMEADGHLYMRDRYGERVLDQARQPIQIAYQPLRRGRWCIDSAGRLWRYRPEGQRKLPEGEPGGGAPTRVASVEMWGGHWRKDDQGQVVKATLWSPVGPGVNQRGREQSTIDWYLHEKGFKHPNDGVSVPTQHQQELLERRAAGRLSAMSASQKYEQMSAGGVRAAEILAATLARLEAAQTVSVSAAQPVVVQPTPKPERKPKPKRKYTKRSNRNAIGPERGGADVSVALEGAARGGRADDGEAGQGAPEAP